MVRGEVEAAVDVSAPWEVQIDQAVDVFLAILAADPVLVSAFQSHLPILGERGLRIEQKSLRSYVDMLLRLTSEQSDGRRRRRPLSRELALMLMALRRPRQPCHRAGDDVVALGPAIKAHFRRRSARGRLRARRGAALARPSLAGGAGQHPSNAGGFAAQRRRRLARARGVLADPPCAFADRPVCCPQLIWRLASLRDPWVVLTPPAARPPRNKDRHGDHGLPPAASRTGKQRRNERALRVRRSDGDRAPTAKIDSGAASIEIPGFGSRCPSPTRR